MQDFFQETPTRMGITKKNVVKIYQKETQIRSRKMNW